MRLAERATSPSARVRRQTAEVAAELLPALGLDEGRYGPDGTRTGGSPDFEATAAALPAGARTAVAVLGLVADPDVLPSGLPSRGRAIGKVLLGGVTAAVASAGVATAVGMATGDAGRVAAAVVSGTAALVAQAEALRADRAHQRLTELLRAAADVRRGLPPDALAVHDRAVADAVSRVATDVRETAAAVAALAAITGQHTAPARPGARALVARRLGGVTPAGTAGRRDRTTTADSRVDQLAVPAPVAPDATPSRRAWAAKAVAGPRAAVAVATVGFTVIATLGFAVPAAAVGGLVASLAAVGVTALVEHAQARHKAGLEGRRTAVEEARRAARAAAEDVARVAAGRVLDDRIAADTHEAERIARRLDGLLADAATGRRPRSVAGPAEVGAAPTEPGGPPATAGDQLVPGPRTGPVAPTALTGADRAGLADLRRALDDVAAARRTARPAAVARARRQAAALGLDAPIGLGTDPDRLGWPHRRAVLDPAEQLRLAALDELPSAVPGPGWAIAKGLAGSVLPSATAAVLGAATLGIAPAVGLAVGAVALAVSVSLGERAGALAKERAKQPSSLWTPAAEQALAAAEAQRTAARAASVAELADQQAENRTRADRLTAHRRDRSRVDPGVGRTVTAPPPAADHAVLHRGTPPAAAPAARPAWRPGYGAALVRAAVPAVVVGVGAAAVLTSATDLAPQVLLQPQTWGALGAPVVPARAAAAGAVAAAASSVVAAGGETLAARSTVEREAGRAKAVEARRARWTEVAQAAEQVALGEAEARARAARDEARADLATARDQLAAAAAGSRRPRLLQLVVDRAAALVAAVETALGRPTPPPPSPTVLALRPGAASGPDPDTEGSARDVAVLTRQVEALRTAAPGTREEAVRAVLDDARRLGLLDPGPDGARRRTALPDVLAVVSGALVGAAQTPGQGEQFWRWVRTVANTTGWWPEEACGCAPGAPCTCPLPAVTLPTATPPPASPAAAPPAAPVRPTPARPPLPYSGPGPVSPPAAHPAPDTGPVVVDVWPDGTGRTTAAVVPVASPGGARVELVVRWVDRGPGARPVLVLSDVPGTRFWWGVPEAVLQAVGQALAVLGAALARLDDAVVLGDLGGTEPQLSELPVTLGGGRPQLVPGRGPRQLDAPEAAAATAALRLRPVADLLGRLRQVLADR